MECPEHGVRQILVPWSEERSRFTALFEALAIWLLQETTLSGLRRVMRLSWDEAGGILDRAVKRGLARRADDPARVIGVDETSFRKGHQYITVVSDLERDRVLWVGDDRKKSTLAAYWAQLPDAHLAGVIEVVMDMWEPYIRATLEGVPDADSKIVIDRYHVAHLLTDGVDRVRRAEQTVLRGQGDARLTGTRFIWIKRPSKRRPSEELRIHQLSRAGFKVGRAWALKEAATRLWAYRYRGWALKYFKYWYFWATHSRLKPMIRVAKTMKRYLPWILNYLRQAMRVDAYHAQNGVFPGTLKDAGSSVPGMQYFVMGANRYELIATIGTEVVRYDSSESANAWVGSGAAGKLRGAS